MERLRTRSSRIMMNTGPLATAAWCLARNIFPSERTWFVEIELHAGESRFAIEIFAEEWGFCVRHGDRLSWIRVTDIPFVHVRDDLELLRETSSLMSIGRLLRSVESRCRVTFDRTAAVIRSDIGGDDAIRAWIAAL